MYLRSLEISGFKSFAKKAELEFSTPITAIVGPNGSGKCVDGSTVVQLKSGERMTIQELFDRAYRSARRIKKYDDGVAVLDSDTHCEVASLNLETQKQEWRPVTAFVRRTAPDTVLTITTRTGRTITATPYHPVFVLQDGQVKALRANGLVQGTRIAVPRRLLITGTMQRLSLAESDILWDEIISVEEKPGNGYVYDLTVAEQHNFVANGVFVHNSNVAEAFRFVLGEQSIKSMRGKRGEDLIWGGGASLARANRGSVQIALNNEARLFPLDFDEIVVERVVHRDGVNEYSINGSRARLRDVQELLLAANIGPTGHHIISQGEADRILSASPKERREMIEDALGLKIYQYKKIESERKLEKTKENISQVRALRKEVQPHLQFLERQVKKIEKSIALREELGSFYKAYLKREELYLEHHAKRLKDARAEPETELRALERELEKAKQVLAEAEKDEKRDALVALEQKLSTLRTKRQEVLRESGRIEGQLGYLERSVAEHARKAEQEEHAPIPFHEMKRGVDSVEQAAQGASALSEVIGLRRVIENMVRILRSFLNETTRTEKNTHEETRLHSELAMRLREKQQNDEALGSIEYDEHALAEEYAVLKRSIEAEASESRAAEREIFRIMGRERELMEIQNNLAREAQVLDRDREEFTRELKEGAALIGHEITRYRESVYDSDGATLEAEAIITEDRGVQLNRRRELEKMKIRLEELGGAGGSEVMKEYQEVKDRDAFLEREIADLEQSITTLEALILDLATKLNEEFIAGIEKISAEFNRFFMLMFGGGSATLVRIKPKVRKKKSDLDGLFEMEDENHLEREAQEDAEAEEGVEIDVKLPNKRVRGLEMLSGGERALTSIALIFAMSQVNPPLFVILDETDAALDEANSRRYGDMIESLAKKSQLILITHNRETMSRAGVLYGVTMGSDGVSKLLSVKFDEAVAVAK